MYLVGWLNFPILKKGPFAGNVLYILEVYAPLLNRALYSRSAPMWTVQALLFWWADYCGWSDKLGWLPVLSFSEAAVGWWVLGVRWELQGVPRANAGSLVCAVRLQGGWLQGLASWI